MRVSRSLHARHRYLNREIAPLGFDVIVGAVGSVLGLGVLFMFFWGGAPNWFAASMLVAYLSTLYGTIVRWRKWRTQRECSQG